MSVPKVVMISSDINEQIDSGQLQFYIGFDKNGRAVAVIPQDTEYSEQMPPLITEFLESIEAVPYYCYCNRNTRTVWCCVGSICWNTGRAC